MVATVTTRGLNIAALSRRTGVAPDTLRKWEQRYAILQPERTAGGQRRYTERDVARVEWLRARLAEGYRIGEAARLLGSSDEPAGKRPADHVRAILAAAEADDVAQVGVRLDQAFALYKLEVVLAEVIEPTLREVGARWQARKLTVAQEHVVSQAVRARLGHVLGDAGGGVRGTVVLACAPGERHELGLMSVGIALRNDGWQVAYVGADTPVADAAALAARVSAAVLGISVTGADRLSELRKALAAASVPSRTHVVVGGAAASPSVAQAVGGRHVGADLKSIVRGVAALA
jgi:DNA-binding transcriptional MerR regulator